MSKKEIDRIRRQVLSWQLPTAWVTLVVAALHVSTARDLDGLEVFAGAKHLTAGCRSHGLLFETIEVEDGADQDVLTPAGLAKTISFLCRVKTRGLLWLGIPCSSWVFVGRANAQRYCFHPEGNTNNEYTSRHNQLAEEWEAIANLSECQEGLQAIWSTADEKEQQKTTLRLILKHGRVFSEEEQPCCSKQNN